MKAFEATNALLNMTKPILKFKLFNSNLFQINLLIVFRVK